MTAHPYLSNPLGHHDRVPLPSPFVFTAGGELREGHLAVETWGTLNAAKDNAVLIYTGLSASAHAASTPQDPTPGWWEDLIGPDRAIDTHRWFVISVNSLGSCFGSSGPGDLNPTTQQPWGKAWPELRLEDIARAGQVVVDHYGVEQLAAVIGVSLGGMVVLAHATLYPGRARHLISISGAMVPSAFAIATRALQREMVGLALNSKELDLGLAFRLARKVGMLSYIGAQLLENRFGHTESALTPGASGTHFEVESWLDHQATKFSSRFNAWSFWSISRAMDLFNLKAHQREMSSHAKTPLGMRLDGALVIGVHEDQLFPLSQQADVAGVLKGENIPTEFVELHSPYGHDAFLVEDHLFSPLLQRYLTQQVAIS